LICFRKACNPDTSATTAEWVSMTPCDAGPRRQTQHRNPQIRKFFWLMVYGLHPGTLGNRFF
jgi:hypothetical protein